MVLRFWVEKIGLIPLKLFMRKVEWLQCFKKLKQKENISWKF